MTYEQHASNTSKDGGMPCAAMYAVVRLMATALQCTRPFTVPNAEDKGRRAREAAQPASARSASRAVNSEYKNTARTSDFQVL